LEEQKINTIIPSSGAGYKIIPSLNALRALNNLKYLNETNLFEKIKNTDVEGTDVEIVLFGTATDGKKNILIDSTKEWPSNFWVSSSLEFLEGENIGKKVLINSNTSNSLIFSAIETNPSTNQENTLLDIFPSPEDIVEAQNILGIKLIPFSEEILNISSLIEVISSSEEKNNYQGFAIQIEEVPFNEKIIRKRAIGLDKNGVKIIQTELSFTTNNQTLINELKAIIDRDNLKAY